MATMTWARRCGAIAGLLALAACGDGPTEVESKPKPTFPVPDEALAAMTCTVQVATSGVTCDAVSPVSGSAQAIIGGQNQKVRLTASNLTIAGNTASFNTTITNLMPFRMGTADGTATTGIRVFFFAGPTATGTGSVDVANPDGTMPVSGLEQPYYHYPEVLALNQTSSAKQWKFTLNGGVQAFTFKVYLQTELLPVVVFDRLVAGNRDVYRVALDGNDLTRLTTNTGEDLDAAVGGGLVVFTSYRNGNAELYSVPLLGGTETRLTNTPSVTETDAALSRDGTRLAYSADPTGSAKIWIANANGTGAARATPVGFGLEASPDAGPAWFPNTDNNRLAYVSTGGGTADIYNLIVGSTPTLLTGNPNSAEITPSFSPEGTMLSYSSNVTGDTELYVRNLSSGSVARLTTRTMTDGAGTWTPDGRIVYLAYTGTGTDNQLRWLRPGTPQAGTIPLAGTGVVLRPVAVPGY
ncbi:TolB family protein [Longimicrobium terrae]|uniref:Dipeptidyl aminopeptidase/acylaminoacyl peptidase n=1 Tax=Longimicrobium terrae TaxID=1639882 RepID=A0A841GX00_9BACT|nr:PD40 domain-containing protein [Longimicrobium terrae]MBB4635611.1 dipeptidyl aminopeptidase/acylaminoacyl peptidase [Longimicrobium terrae]MBB6070005.1 dipeptidyl aminopeptidase/acylaminoacyl peptidase [Longimicrobium terrae]NNC32915.1 hypothetical protein [Longimicrobium terrae]